MDVSGLFQVLQLLYFFFLLFEITTCNVDFSMRVGKQGPFMYSNFHKRINGSVLRKAGSLISALEVNNDIDCASFCVMNKLCLSVNFGPNANRTGKVVCELLNYGGTDYKKYLVKKDKFFFMRMETICSKNPCGGNAVCIPQLQNSYHPYTCNCTESCLAIDKSKCHALGIEDGRILNSQMTASSAAHWAPAYNGRLNNGYGCWMTSSPGAAWLQVRLLNRTLIKGVATQGRHNYVYHHNYFVKTYQLSYSDDGRYWTIYKENGIEKVFQGNNYHSVIKKNLLAEPLIAKLVRLLPISYNGYPSIRMELYGCPV